MTEQDTLESCKEKFVNLISELNDSQFHEFQEFVATAMGKSFFLMRSSLDCFDRFKLFKINNLLVYRGIS